MNTPSSITPVTLDTIISLCKRKGFVFPSAEIYGGINGVYDFGHLGVLIKDNIRYAWLASLENPVGKILRIEGALLGPTAMWKASGHIDGFHDPLVDCKSCKKRYRADDIDLNKNCPHCGNKDWTDIRSFNMMFKTNLGAMEGGSTDAFLRPETAQSIYVNFKNFMSTYRVKLPFGIAQIGKAFRNEITPKQFLFRMREFEQMEMQWFCKAEDASQFLDLWVEHRLKFYEYLGIPGHKIRAREQEADERAHYSTRCVDIEYEFPFGWKEIEGIAHRGNFDLTQHTTHSGKDLGIHDEATKTTFIPHIVEASSGVDRLFLMLMTQAYHEDVVEDEKRVVLKLHNQISPYKAAFLPLTKHQEEATQSLYENFRMKGLPCEYDDTGSIGKRYRRQDEIGTPFCITYDFESNTDNCVTVRNRDTTEQVRIAIDQLEEFITTHL